MARSWLPAWLSGRGPQLPPPSDEGDRRLALLRDLRADSDALEAYCELAVDPSALEEEFSSEITPEVMKDHALLVTLQEAGLAIGFDWVGDPAQLLRDFNLRLAAAGAPTIDEAAAQAIRAYADAKPQERGDYVGWMFGPLAERAARTGLRILNVHDASDMYKFLLVDEIFARKWKGVSLSKRLEVEDPSWQFEKQLRGSPYERFYTAG